MALDRFRNSPTGQVITVGQGEAAYHAFVPNPLPPSIPWDDNLLHVLAQAEQAVGRLAAAMDGVDVPTLIRREAVASSRIEGLAVDLADLVAYEGTGETGRARADDLHETLNCVRALEYGWQRLDTLPMSLRLMRELHSILLDGVREDQTAPGEFRRSQNWIGQRGATLNDAIFVPPPVPQMHDALNQLEKYIHTEHPVSEVLHSHGTASTVTPTEEGSGLHTFGSLDASPSLGVTVEGFERAAASLLVRLALIHYQFETIHPFLDGNGRVGRLVNALLPVAWGLMPVPLLISRYLERHRQEYIDLLGEVSERGIWYVWLEFVLQGIIEEAN